MTILPMKVHHDVSQRLQVLVENIIASQRALTRAVDRGDTPERELACLERDRAVEALYAYVGSVESERDRISLDRRKLASDVMQLRYVLSILASHDPMLVQSAQDKAGVPTATDARLSESFLLRLNDAVSKGLAVRAGEGFTITADGIMELVSSGDRAEKLVALRAENFVLEGRLRALESRPNTTPSIKLPAARPAAARGA